MLNYSVAELRFIKIIVKVSRMLSNSICDFLFGKEDEQ